MAAEDLTITQLVYNRLRFLEQTPENDALIQDFIYEVAYELEMCFNVRLVDNGTVIPTEDWTRVGEDQYYRLDQKSIIADLVASYLLSMYVLSQSTGTPDGTAPATTFLKRAKAGSAEVEWAQFSVKDGSVLFLSAQALLDKYKNDAARKARNLGCVIDICDDCVSISTGFTGDVQPFVTVNSGNCGCC